MPTTPDADELEELPPLDGDANEAPVPEAGEDDVDDPAGDATLDDTTGEGDPVDASDLEVDESESGWVDEPSDAKDLDLGDPDMATFAEEPLAPADVDEPGAPIEDYGFGDAPEHGGLDAGEEGPVDPDEELRAEDLPALDADEEGEVAESSLVDAGFAAEEPVALPWAEAPWERVGAPVGPVSVQAVVCGAAGTIAAGRGDDGEPVLARVDLEGESRVLAAAGLAVAGVHAMTAQGRVVAAVDDGGALLVSRDGGASFGPVAIGDTAAEVALALETTWVRTRAGGLRCGRTGAGRVERRDAPGTVEALAADAAGGVAALVSVGSDEGQVFFRVAPDGSTSRDDAGPYEARVPAVLAVRGSLAAFAARGGGVAVRGASGAWSLVPWGGTVTAMAWIDDAGILLVATYSAVDDATSLVRLGPNGRAVVVARVGPSRHDPDCDGRATALAHDVAHGVVWLAGRFGLAAFAVR